MDILADVFAATRTSGSILFHGHFRPPWGMRFQRSTKAGFHVVLRGECWLHAGRRAPRRLGTGDIVFLPAGWDHTLTNHPDTAPLVLIDETGPRPIPQARSAQSGVNARDRLVPATAAPPPGSTTLLCGAYRHESGGAHPILSLLPPLIHIPGAQALADDELQAVLGFLTREMCGCGPGANAIATRLIDIVFLLLVRRWLADQPEAAAGWLGALRDPAMTRALAAIHREPHTAWTVDTLAREAGMSRGGFARRFARLVGEPPLTYLTRWRMDLAARLLRDSEQPVNSIAHELGYDSEFAFAKAFKRVRGMPPTTYRARTRAGKPAAAPAAVPLRTSA